MSTENGSKRDIPDRIPLRLEFHYEVDELGESYRVWEEQFRKSVSIGGSRDDFERRVSS